MTIDIVIPNYNGANLLKKNLPKTIDNVKKYNWEIIIVDDASEESQKEELKKTIKAASYKKITLLENEKNFGFATSVNRGVRHSNADLVVLLNTDTIPETNFLEPVLKRFEKDELLFGVGCMDKSVEDGQEVLRGRGIGKWEKGFLRHAKGDVESEKTLWISGGSSVVRRSLFEKVRGFDELFNPFYWEDLDLSYRAQKAGYNIVFEKNSVVLHKHEEGAIKSNFTKKEVKKIAFRNELIFIWKNITNVKFLFSHAFYLKLHILRSLFKKDTIPLTSTFLALSKFPDIMAKRKQQKKLFTKSDREILSQFK